MGYSSRNYSSSGETSPWAWILGIVGAVFVIWFLIFIISLLTARTTPLAGDIGVVRSGPSGVWVGSWFNGHNIKKVIPPGAGSSFTGLGSETHYYPSSSVQRTYTITSDPSRGDRPGVDVVEVPTSNGVRVGIEGAFYFTTAFDNTPQGEKLTRDFDNRFGVRTFPVVGTDSELHPWEGTDGWSAFLDTVIRPIIDNDLRRSIGQFTCAQLYSPCAYVNNNGNGQNAAQAANGGQNAKLIQAIQDQINNGLKQDIASTLGVDYFSNIQFLFSKVTPPGAIQNQIDNAQAQFASVGAAAAEYQRNLQLAKAKEALNRAYQACPACATIDELKQLPNGLTTLVLGGNGSGTSIALGNK